MNRNCKILALGGDGQLGQCISKVDKLKKIEFIFFLDKIEENISRLLNEEDITKPINVYDKTKLGSEFEIINLLSEFYIIQTSWLYSEFVHNLVKAMRRLSSEKDELNVIVDQIGTRTYWVDLAGAILDIVKSNNKTYGTYHFSNAGLTSWYDFAKAIFDISGITIRVTPILEPIHLCKTVRPAFSAIDKAKIRAAFGLEIPYWRDSLINCIQELNMTY